MHNFEPLTKMDGLPKRTSLVRETANTLKDWIEAGILRGTLPGELPLKMRLGVGRDTLRLALRLLEREGWTTPTSRGRQRQVQIGHVPSTTRANSARLPVTFLSPERIVDRQVLLEMEDLQMRLTKQGRDLRFASPNIFHLAHPDRLLERLVRQQPSAAWILYSTGEMVQRWFDERNIPAFIYGAPFTGINLPFTVNDWEEGTFHAGIQLLRHGHRIIGIMENEHPSPGTVAAERGLRRALATIGTKGKLVILKEDRSPASVARAYELIFSLKQRPTGLVLTNSAQLLTGYSWLASKGIRTPGDISLVAIANDSCFAEFHPPPCFYRCNSQVLARHIGHRVMELVDNGQVSQKSVRVHLEYVPGATIAPPPANLRQVPAE
ncbi:MAG TPA: substrate-binding domain-containing protein [Verrucomicrobiae bacterium]|nr:substrate-binding domain-containing protein [Verrucomicrobiae bacterium]